MSQSSWLIFHFSVIQSFDNDSFQLKPKPMSSIRKLSHELISLVLFFRWLRGVTTFQEKMLGVTATLTPFSARLVWALQPWRWKSRRGVGVWKGAQEALTTNPQTTAQLQIQVNSTLRTHYLSWSEWYLGSAWVMKVDYNFSGSSG